MTSDDIQMPQLILLTFVLEIITITITILRVGNTKNVSNLEGVIIKSSETWLLVDVKIELAKTIYLKPSTEGSQLYRTTPK